MAKIGEDWDGLRMSNLRYLDIGWLLYLLRLCVTLWIRRIIIVVINDDVFFFQLSKPETGLKTPPKQSGMNIQVELRKERTN